jgi:hypothetical protein
MSWVHSDIWCTTWMDIASEFDAMPQISLQSMLCASDISLVKYHMIIVRAIFDAGVGLV